MWEMVVEVGHKGLALVPLNACARGEGLETNYLPQLSWKVKTPKKEKSLCVRGPLGNQKERVKQDAFLGSASHHSQKPKHHELTFQNLGKVVCGWVCLCKGPSIPGEYLVLKCK